VRPYRCASSCPSPVPNSERVVEILPRAVLTVALVPVLDSMRPEGKSL
jgi:hypothetical protein